MLIALGIADLIMLGAFLLTMNRLPPQIPLFYSRQWGEFQLADLWFIALLPLLMHIFFFLNILFVRRVFPGEAIANHIIRIANWTLVVLFTGIFLKIIFLVT